MCDYLKAYDETDRKFTHDEMTGIIHRLIKDRVDQIKENNNFKEQIAKLTEEITLLKSRKPRTLNKRQFHLDWLNKHRVDDRQPTLSSWLKGTKSPNPSVKGTLTLVEQDEFIQLENTTYYEAMKQYLENAIDTPPHPFYSFENLPHTLFVFDKGTESRWKVAELDTVELVMDRINFLFIKALTTWDELNMEQMNMDTLLDENRDHHTDEKIENMRSRLGPKVGDHSYSKEGKLREIKRLLILRARQEDDEVAVE